MDKGFWLTLAIAWILLGLCMSYLISGTEGGFWEKYYYVWDKGKDVLLVFCLSLFVLGTVRLILWALLVFLLIRLLWEALAIPNYELASRWEIIDVLFAVDVAVMVFIYIKSWRSTN